MSKRTAERARRKRLEALMEENDAKSPDILTAIVVAEEALDAYRIAGIYEETTKEDLPFPLDEWYRTINKLPVELYFVFKQKKARLRFINKVKREFPQMEIVI